MGQQLQAAAEETQRLRFAQASAQQQLQEHQHQQQQQQQQYFFKQPQVIAYCDTLDAVSSPRFVTFICRHKVMAVEQTQRGVLCQCIFRVHS